MLIIKTDSTLTHRHQQALESVCSHLLRDFLNIALEHSAALNHLWLAC